MIKQKAKKHRMHISLLEKIYDRLRLARFKEKRPITQIIEQAVVEYFNRRKKGG